MSIQIKSTANLSSQMGVKCLGYGRAGVGKTRLCASAPNPIVLSAEKGLLSLKQFRLPYIEINGIKSLAEAYDWILKSAEAKKFDTICLDSVSEMAEQVISEEGEKTRDPRKLYPEYQRKMTDLLRDYRDIPQKHIYFIAKETKTQSSDNTIIAGPSFPGKALPEAAPYFFDQVFQIVAHTDPQTQQTQNMLKCRADFGSEGKDRSGALSLWEPYDLSAMFRKIMAT